MPTNDFLPIGQASSTMLSQSEWSALSQRTAGWAAGILPPEHYNKGLRQSSVIAAMIGEFIKSVGGLDALDNGNNSTLLANFIAALDARIGGGTVDSSTFRTVKNGPLTAPPGSPAAGDEVLVQDSPTGAFSGNARKLATYNGSIWTFSPVGTGRIFRVGNTDTYWTLNASTGWQTFTVPISIVSGLQAALDGKLSLTGGTLSGTLYGTIASLSGLLYSAGVSSGGTIQAEVADNANAFQVNKTGGAAVAALCPVNLGSSGYGLGVWRYTIADGSSGWNAVWDKDGKLGLGGLTAPLTTLDVNGPITARGDICGPSTSHAYTIGANPSPNAGVGGFVQLWGSTSAAPGRVVIGSSSLSRFQVDGDGSVAFSGDKGTTGKVLTGNASGPPTWKTFAEIGIGKKLIIDGNGTFLNTSSLTVTLPAAEVDALYSVKAFCIGVIDGALQFGMGSVSKTTTGFTVSVGWTYSTPANVLVLYTATR